MNPRAQVLKDLVRDDRYVVDAGAVAEAIVLRARALHVLPDVALRGSAEPPPQVRSFRPQRGARSFRLSRGVPRRPHGGEEGDPSRAARV